VGEGNNVEKNAGNLISAAFTFCHVKKFFSKQFILAIYVTHFVVRLLLCLHRHIFGHEDKWELTLT
jgi:hypothetical protein